MTRAINPEAFPTRIDPADFSTGDTTFEIPGYSDPANFKKEQEEFPEHDFWEGKTIQGLLRRRLLQRGQAFHFGICEKEKTLSLLCRNQYPAWSLLAQGRGSQGDCRSSRRS